MALIHELIKKEDLFAQGHGLCPGCGVPIILRYLLRATDDPIVISNATGCLEVCTSRFPWNSWKTNWIHSAFENAAATISGIEAMYKSLKKQGKIPEDKNIKFLAIGGDGGSYDIGFQAISGAMERGHNIVYVVYDNQSYANTGGQRSSATPMGASTTTAPAGKVLPGKLQWRKNITFIMADHGIPYAAQAAPHNWNDLYKKAKKAFEVDGPAFLSVLTPCPTEWKTKPEDSIKLSRIAADTLVWPLYEIENGKVKVNYKPKKVLPVEEWLKPQGRFKHLFKEENKWIIEEIQKKVNEEWERLLKLETL